MSMEDCEPLKEEGMFGSTSFSGFASFLIQDLAPMVALLYLGVSA